MVIRQPDHGVQAGLIAKHWGNENTPPFEPRDELIAAIRHHDDGWIAWEENPSMDPTTGHPRHFYQLSPREHIPLYRRGIILAVERHPVTGLFVSMHGAGLYNGRYGSYHLFEPSYDPNEQLLVDEFLEEQRQLQEELISKIENLPTSFRESQVMYTYLLLQVWDRLSLQFTYFMAADGEIAPLPHPDGSSTTLFCRNDGVFSLRLDPYPFDEPQLIFPVEVRYLPDKAYGESEEFLAEMEKAEVKILECCVRPV
jgi:hypothetical protein